MDTKRIGNIGEALCLSRFVEYGIPVYLQFGDNEFADYIVIVNNKTYKIQVKTSFTYDGNTVVFDLTSSTVCGKKHCKHKYSVDEVDYFVCCDAVNKELYLIKNTGNMRSVTLRFLETKNNQSLCVKYAKDFILNEEAVANMY